MTRTIHASQVYRSSQLVPIDLIRLTTYTDRDAATVDRRFYFARQPVRIDWNNLGVEYDFWPVIQRIGSITPEINHLAYPDDSGVLTKPLTIDLSNEPIPGESNARLIAVLREQTLENATLEWTQVLLAERPDGGRVDLSALAGDEHTFWYRGRVKRVGPIDEATITLSVETDMPTLTWTREMNQLTNDPKDYGKRIPAPFGPEALTRLTGTIVGWVTTLSMPLDPSETGIEDWVTDPTGFPDAGGTFEMKIGHEEVTAERNGATGLNISVRAINSTKAQQHQAGEICIEMLSGNIDFTASGEDDWGTSTGQVSPHYLFNPQSGELVRMTKGTPMGGKTDVVAGETRAIIRFSQTTLREAIEEIFGKAFGSTGASTLLLPFHTKEHWTAMTSDFGDSLYNGENIGTNPKLWGEVADSTYEGVRAWWPTNSIPNSSRIITRWRGRHVTNVKNTHGTEDIYARMMLRDFSDDDLGGTDSAPWENVDVEILENREVFGNLAVGAWITPDVEGVTLAALEGSGPGGNIKYCILYGQVETASGAPVFNADEYIEWTFYGLEIELQGAASDLAGSFVGFNLDIWAKCDGRYSPTTSPDYKCGDNEIMEHPVDIIRFWVEEVGGGTLDYDSYDEAYGNLGTSAVWSFDARTLGDGSFEGVLARMAYEARATIIPEETATGTVWKILTAPSNYAWRGVTADPITEWEEFTETAQDVGVAATHASRFTYGYAPNFSKGTTEDAYAKTLIVNADQNDISTKVPTANLTAAEAKLGLMESDPWAFKCIQDDDTAKDAAGWYTAERIRVPARLFALKGVPWWQAYATEVGDRLFITPPYETEPVRCRVISYTKDPETERIDLRLVGVAPSPPQTTSIDDPSDAAYMKSNYSTDMQSHYFASSGTWTVHFRHKESLAEGSRANANVYFQAQDWDYISDPDDKRITIQYNTNASPNRLEVYVYDAGGSRYKFWTWTADAGNNFLFDTEDQWYSTFVTWDGAHEADGEIKVYTGTTGNEVDLGPPDNKYSDSGNVWQDGDHARTMQIGIGAQFVMHNTVVWNEVLPSASREFLYANKAHDLREDSGDYAESDTLEVYFRHGEGGSTGGENKADNDLDFDMWFSGTVDEDDVVSDVP